MGSKLNIVFCTDGVFPHMVGGMQRHSRLLVEALAKTGECHITVIHPHEGDLVFSGVSNVREISIPGVSESRNYLKECYTYSKRVYMELKALPEDSIIYSQGLSVWYKAASLSHRLIVNPHGLEPFQALSIKDKLIATAFKLIFRHIFRRARYVVSLGGKLTGILESILLRENIVEIPNAINLPALSSNKAKPDSNKPIQLLFVARFAHNKGIHILMQAIDKLNDIGMGKQLTFKLAGKGPLFDKYLSEITAENVKLLGFVSDEELLELYRSSDVYVFPTLFEGMPTVVLEAMANYLPVIVSDTGATAELVDEKNGYLIQAGSVDALANTIVRYCKLSSKQKNEMSLHSYERVSQNFTWEHVASKHIKLFNMVRGH